ncbi:MAG TPA: HesA/MoeB/ThiF family protein [bacterium]
MGLTKEEIARYSRQLILPEVGVGGQERLRRASVALIGAGGLGSPAALYLAGSGVGTLGLIDSDEVAASDLHRQLLHATASLGRAKTESGAERLRALNPAVKVRTHRTRLTAENAPELLAGYQLVLDGSDNFPTRYAVNDACVLGGIPLVHGGVVQFRGQVLTVLPRRSACLRCVFPEPPEPGAIPSCREAGVLGPEAGVIGSLMAHEALKLMLGFGTPLADRLLVFDGAASSFRTVPVRRDPACAVCGDHSTIVSLPPASAGGSCVQHSQREW